MNQSKLIFLKLGGSLITDKTKPLTPRPDVIQRLSAEIAQAYRENPQMRLVIGHGSGSFGHAIASLYQTQTGGKGGEYWHGFAEVWRAARQLNQILINKLSSTGLPVIAFPPSAGLIATNKNPESWDTHPIKIALSHNLIPVVQGDVVFDTELGGTIFSTEQVFQVLSREFLPDRILLAGIDQGVYHDPKQPADIIPYITPSNISNVFPSLSGAKAMDVTGGMLAKVRLMLSLVQENPSLEVQVFSGVEAGNIQKALAGKHLGTLITG